MYFPLFLYRRESFLVVSINTELFYLFFSGDSQRFSSGSKWIDLKKVQACAPLEPQVIGRASL